MEAMETVPLRTCPPFSGPLFSGIYIYRSPSEVKTYLTSYTSREDYFRETPCHCYCSADFDNTKAHGNGSIWGAKGGVGWWWWMDGVIQKIN